MRISDWSSDVCSSDLALNHPVDIDAGRMNMIGIEASSRHDLLDLRDRHSAGSRHVGIEVTSGLSIDEISFRISLPRLDDREVKIGRASCRERVCQYV